MGQEALYLGQIGILPDEKWARSMVTEDYPFFYKDRNELRAKFKMACDNYFKFIDVVKKQREYIKKNYNINDKFDDLDIQVNEINNKMFSEKSQLAGMVEVVKDVIGGIEEITWDELALYVMEKLILNIDINNPKSKGSYLDKIYFYKLMLYLGYKDIGNFNNIIFKKYV